MSASASHLQSLLKAVSWRVFGSLTTGLLVYGFTGNRTAALSIGGIEAFGKIFLFYCHERLWHQLHVRGINRKKFAVKGEV